MCCHITPEKILDFGAREGQLTYKMTPQEKVTLRAEPEVGVEVGPAPRVVN